MYLSELRRFLHSQSPNEIKYLRMQTTVFEMNFAFSVVICASKSNRPTSHFRPQLLRKLLNYKTETRVVENIAMQKMFGNKIWNETYQVIIYYVLFIILFESSNRCCLPFVLEDIGGFQWFRRLQGRFVTPVVVTLRWKPPPMARKSTPMVQNPKYRTHPWYQVKKSIPSENICIYEPSPLGLLDDQNWNASAAEVSSLKNLEYHALIVVREDTIGERARRQKWHSPHWLESSLASKALSG